MIRIRWMAMFKIALGLLFIIGFASVYWQGRSWVKIGDHRLRINRNAKINPKKHYQLRFWDYDLPLRVGNQTYEQYLRRIIAEFQQTYPNIRVELKLLDLLTGPIEFKRALTTNQGPDVYGGFYENPELDFGHLIPVGLFLKEEEQNSYPEAIRKLQSSDGILCALPRWVSANIWVGNRQLLERCGVDVKTIQNQGWGWEELLQMAGRLPEKTHLLTGSPVAADWMQYWYMASKQSGRELGTNLAPLQTLIAQKRLASELEKNQITRFVTGRAALLAGVRPRIFSIIAKDEAARGWEAIWLPAPGYGDGRETQFIDGGFLTVYRHRLTKGDDQLVAAVKLAYFLSTYPDKAPWIDMGALPVPSNGELTGVSGFLNQLVTRSDLSGKDQREELKGLIRQWFDGQLDAKQFETELDNILVEKTPSFKGRDAKGNR